MPRQRLGGLGLRATINAEIHEAVLTTHRQLIEEFAAGLAGLQPILAKWRELRATHWQGALSTAPVPTFEELATDLPGSKAAAFLTAPRALGANVAATIQYSGPFSLSRTWRRRSRIARAP